MERATVARGADPAWVARPSVRATLRISSDTSLVMQAAGSRSRMPRRVVTFRDDQPRSDCHSRTSFVQSEPCGRRQYLPAVTAVRSRRNGAATPSGRSLDGSAEHGPNTLGPSSDRRTRSAAAPVTCAPALLTTDVEAGNRVDAIEDKLPAGQPATSRAKLGALRRVLVRLQRLLAPEPAALFAC